MTDLLLHGCGGLLLGLLGIPLLWFLFLAIGKEVIDFLDYGLFSCLDLLYGLLGFVIGWYTIRFFKSKSK